MVRTESDLPAAIAMAGIFDHEVMLETYIEGREFTVGILDEKPLAVGEIILPSEVFDYTSNYQRGGAKEVFPAEISPAATQEIQEFGLRVHKALKLGGYSRIDFRMDASGQVWCLEANSVPGLTPTSLLRQSAKAVRIGFSELCERNCQLAIR